MYKVEDINPDSEFKQSFEIKGYGDGMAPSLLKPVKVQRQRPSSMLVKPIQNMQ